MSNHEDDLDRIEALAKKDRAVGAADGSWPHVVIDLVARLREAKTIGERLRHDLAREANKRTQLVSANVWPVEAERDRLRGELAAAQARLAEVAANLAAEVMIAEHSRDQWRTIAEAAHAPRRCRACGQDVTVQP